MDSLSTWALATFGALIAICLIEVVSLEIVVAIATPASLIADWALFFLGKDHWWGFVSTEFEVADSNDR